MFRLTVAVLFALTATAVLASDPRTAIADARQAIAAGEYDRALGVLTAAMPDAQAITDVVKRNDALAALHFYSAVAYSGKGATAQARAELTEFLKLHPGQSSIDSKKYSPDFVKLFDEVVPKKRKTSFDLHHPGWDPFAIATPKETPLLLWGATPEVQILATEDEKHRWETLKDDHERRAFVASFWSGRDPAWHEEFNRRVAFADEEFGNPMLRGALTDRGEIFVLFGPPVRFAGDPSFESWTYLRAQLPSTVRQGEVTFRFAQSQSTGELELLRHFFTDHVISEGKKAIGARH